MSSSGAGSALPGRSGFLVDDHRVLDPGVEFGKTSLEFREPLLQEGSLGRGIATAFGTFTPSEASAKTTSAQPATKSAAQTASEAATTHPAPQTTATQSSLPEPAAQTTCLSHPAQAAGASHRPIAQGVFAFDVRMPQTLGFCRCPERFTRFLQALPSGFAV